jgi:hypothetical protein
LTALVGDKNETRIVAAISATMVAADASPAAAQSATDRPETKRFGAMLTNPVAAAAMALLTPRVRTTQF